MEVVGWSRCIVGMKGTREMATEIAVRLKQAGFSGIFLSWYGGV